MLKLGGLEMVMLAKLLSIDQTSLTGYNFFQTMNISADLGRVVLFISLIKYLPCHVLFKLAFNWKISSLLGVISALNFEITSAGVWSTSIFTQIQSNS